MIPFEPSHTDETRSLSDPSPDAGLATETEPAETRQRRAVRSLIEWVLVIAGALLVALFIQTFFFQTFYIPSESMEPTLTEYDRVIVNKVSYRLHSVNRGDLVVFGRPPNEPPSEIDELIKRVIGLGGETIEGRSGSVYIDGQRLIEPYLDGAEFAPFGPVQVPENHVFVLGDNRNNSRDSRYFGPISEDLIVGRAFVLVWPAGRWTFL